jgi:tetratricopeptide (TPR) repeat protein
MASVKTAFLSSTGKDLAKHRRAAYRAIEGLDGWHCLRMEDFGARNWQADPFCRAKVAECDLLVGIVGPLHGECPRGSEQSYTEREYDAAVAANVPRLMFIAPENFSLPANLIEPAKKRLKQQAFRKRVSTELVRATFTSPTDLGRRVVQAIRNWEREQPTQEQQPAAARAEGVMPLPPQPYFAHPYPLQEHFTGRARERQMLTQWLAGDDHPILALVAIGGMGKSALTWAWLQRDVLDLPLPGQPKDEPAVTQVCRVPEEARPEGVLWWSFYEREAGCAALLNEALTYASGGSVDPTKIDSDYEKIRKLLPLLQKRRLLLVLDGLERQLRAYANLSAAYQGDVVVEDAQGDFRACTDPHAAAFLTQVAALAGGSRVLFTSRLFPRELDGLAGCRREELTGLDPVDGVAFFQAHGVKGTRAEIEAVCQPYGYLPLALRLLAGMIVRDKRMPGDIRVAGRHPVLPELKGKEQHHILQVAYNALDEQTQALLSRIAAFRSPMSYDAVAVLNPFKSDDQLDAALRELIDRGLLLFDPQRSRYDLHPIVRQYAYDRLTDKAGVHSRLRDYFAAVPAPEKDKVQSMDDLAPVIELYHHTIGAGRYDEALKLFRDRLVAPLYFQFGAYQTSIELLRALFPDGEDRPPRLKDEGAQGWTLNTLAVSYSLSGQSRRAVPLFEASNAIDERRGARTSVAIGLENLAFQQIALGELAAAAANLDRAIALSREVGDERSEAAGQQQLGRLLAYEGAFAEAAQELDATLALADKLAHKQGAGIIWADRALRALLMSEGKPALAAARRARELADEVARTRFPVERDIIRVEWLLGAALVALTSKDKSPSDELLSEAEGHLTEALTRCRRINMVELEPDILLAWARWHCARGNGQQAREHAQEALAIADRCEYRLKQADVHNFLARLALDDGDQPAARQQAQIARERAQCDGPPHCYQPALEEADRLLAEAERLP